MPQHLVNSVPLRRPLPMFFKISTMSVLKNNKCGIRREEGAKKGYVGGSPLKPTQLFHLMHLNSLLLSELSRTTSGYCEK